MSLFRGEEPILGSGATVRMTDGASNSSLKKVPVYHVVTISGLVAASVTSNVVFIAPPSLAKDGQYKLSGVDAIWTTASTSGTLDVVKATGTTAVASGTTLLTGTVDMSTTANTVNSASLVTDNTNTLSAGDRVGYKLGGTLTSLAGLTVVFRFERV